MKLYLLKRDHHDGQSFYGVFESEELGLEQVKTLRQMMKFVPESEYSLKEITLNELTEIDPYD